MKTTLLRATFLSAMAASMGLVACMDQPSATGPSDQSATGLLITTPSEEPLVGSQASAGAATAAGSIPTAQVAESKLPLAPVRVVGDEIHVVTQPIPLVTKPAPVEPIGIGLIEPSPLLPVLAAPVTRPVTVTPLQPIETIPAAPAPGAATGPTTPPPTVTTPTTPATPTPPVAPPTGTTKPPSPPSGGGRK